jgi:adenylate cyclase
MPADGDARMAASPPPAPPSVLLPPVLRFADQAAIGIVNVTTDRSGTPSSIPMLFRTSDAVELSFPVRIAAVATGKQPVVEPNRLLVGERSIATDADHALPITFYGPRRTLRTIGAASVLAGEIAAEAIRQRIVVIGATVTGGGDFFPTPFDYLMPGVEVISTAITRLLAGDEILRNPSVRLADRISAIALPMILVGLLAWRRTNGPGCSAHRRRNLGERSHSGVFARDLVERSAAVGCGNAAGDFRCGGATVVGGVAGRSI